MKSIPASWSAALASGGCTPIELYTVYLDNETLYYCNAGDNIEFPIGGQTYTALHIKRSPVECSLDGAVTELTGSLDDIDLALVNKLSPDKFSGRRVSVKKILYEARDASGDSLTIFDGAIDTVSYNDGKLGIKLIFNFGLGSLNKIIPRRRFCSYCNYKFGDTWCTINKEAAENKVTGTASAGTTTTLVDASLSQADDYWVPGMLVITSGTNSGDYREVSDFVNSTSTLTVRVPFPSAIDSSSAYTLYRMCNKTVSDCSTRFNNYINFGGFAEIPKTPVI